MISPDSEGITKINSLKLEDGPHRIAINENSNSIYVLNVWSNSVASIDGRTNTISEQIYLTDARDIAVDPKNNRICVLGNRSISEIDTTTNKLIRSFELPYIQVSSDSKMALDYGRNLIYLANTSGRSVDVLDLETGKMILSISLKKKPVDIEIDEMTKIIYVGFESPATLIVIDGNTNKVTKEMDLRVKESKWRLSSKKRYLREIYQNHSIGRLYVLYKQPFFIPESSYSGRTEYQDSILILDLNSWTILGDQKLRIGSNHLYIDQKNNKCYCVNSHDKELEVLNEDCYSEFLTIRLQGDKYDGMAMNSITNKLYIATRSTLREALLEICDIA